MKIIIHSVDQATEEQRLILKRYLNVEEWVWNIEKEEQDTRLNYIGVVNQAINEFEEMQKLFEKNKNKSLVELYKIFNGDSTNDGFFDFEFGSLSNSVVLMDNKNKPTLKDEVDVMGDKGFLFRDISLKALKERSQQCKINVLTKKPYVDKKIKCPKCSMNLFNADVTGYDFTCLYCDENFYNCEVERK